MKYRIIKNDLNEYRVQTKEKGFFESWRNRRAVYNQFPNGKDGGDGFGYIFLSGTNAKIFLDKLMDLDMEETLRKKNKVIYQTELNTK